ncbi:MAG TPA: apolipoprotein N-acyltransferase [Streptosporangiaceae bacterium]|nr:apolipoprotein N-acyltransferase [Streptosporangiaceae bacterium]
MISAEASTAPRQRGRNAGGQPGLRLRWALLVALAGGLLLAAAFPPLGIWPLAAVGAALLTVALAGRNLRASFLAGLVFGVAFFFPLLSWVLNVWWFAWTALALGSAVILAVLAVAQRLLLRLPGWPIAVAGWWVGLEALRDRFPFGGFPWGRLAMSQAAAPTAGWAAIGGAPVLSFVVALVGAALAWLILSARPGRGPERPALRQLALPALAVVAAAGLAAAGALLPVDPTSGTKTAEVAAVQGNVPRARNLPQQLNDTEVTQNHTRATEQLAAQVKAGLKPAPDLVIWPENSTDLDPFDYPAIYQQITSAVHDIARPVLVGEVLNDPELNVGQLWLPDRGPTTTYAKRQLVPFGEYIPWRGLVSHLTSLPSLQPVDFTPGHAAVVFRTGSIRLGDVICYEIGFDRLVRSEVTAGANLLTMQTNDADFEIDGQTGESGQQLAMARIRAVESDRAVVVASTTGVSAIIAPDGRLITHSGTWQQAVLEARVPLVTDRTWADDVGAWPEWVIVGLTALALLGAAAGYRRQPLRAL